MLIHGALGEDAQIVLPCDACGKLALLNGTCPYCGHTRVDEAAEVVGWLASLPPDARRGAIRARMKGWPRTMLRAYKAWTRDEASGEFVQEAALLAEAGYRPVAQEWVDHRYATKYTEKQSGQLLVTYRLID